MTIPARPFRPPARLVVVRHGQSTWNAERRWQGWADPPLSELGREQAAQAARHLEGWGLTAVCASDLARARATAAAVAEHLGLGPVEVDPDLRERDVGLFTGRTADEIRRLWPDCFDPDTGRLVSVPEGEDDDRLWRRASPALVRVAGRHPGGVVLVVSHGGVLRAVDRHLGIEPPAATPNLTGRWLEAGPEGLAAGDPVALLEPAVTTAPASE